MTTSELQQGPPTTRKQMKIRQAQGTDATAIAELGAHIFTVTFGHSVPPHDFEAYLKEAYTPSAIAQDLEDDAKDVIVATNEEDDIVGFAYLTRGSTEPSVADVQDKAELQRIYLHSTAQGTGLGHSLAATIEAMAKEQGFKNLWLGVWEENEKGIKAYTRWGYRKVGQHDFVLGTIAQTDHIMLKEL